MSSRRRLLLALGATALVVLPLGWMWQASLTGPMSVMDMGYVDLGGGPAMKHPMGHAQHGGPAGVSVTDLVDPSTAKPDVRVTLTARRATLHVGGETIDGYTLNGTSPGPTITADEGDLVEVVLRNTSVADGVALHWHGLDVPNAMDGVAGVTQDAVLPGKSHTYRFTVHQTGTYWYHSHQVSHEQVARGLLGALVIRPSDGVEQGRDVTALAHTYRGIRTLNGRAADTVVRAKAGERVRVRVINTDNGPTGVWSDAPYRVVAIDGGDLHRPTPVRDQRLDVAAGGRADLELAAPTSGASRVQVGTSTAVLIRTSPGAAPERPASPARVLDLATYGTPASTALRGKPDRTFDYSIGRRPGFLDGLPGFWWTVNGHLFPDVPMYTVREGDLVAFHIDNHSGEAHPMHLHGHHALVTAIDGKAPTGSPLWVDSIDVADDQTVDLLFRADNPGIWMDHCHNLPHAAQGLVAHLMYEGVTTPYRIGDLNEPE